MDDPPSAQLVSPRVSASVVIVVNLVGNRILTREMTAFVLTGYIDADYGGRDGYGFETRLVNGVKIAGHRGSLAGSANQVEFYPWGGSMRRTPNAERGTRNRT